MTGNAASAAGAMARLRAAVRSQEPAGAPALELSSCSWLTPGAESIDRYSLTCSRMLPGRLSAAGTARTKTAGYAAKRSPPPKPVPASGGRPEEGGQSAAAPRQLFRIVPQVARPRR